MAIRTAARRLVEQTERYLKEWTDGEPWPNDNGTVFSLFGDDGVFK
jgi:hypothetical protein